MWHTAQLFSPYLQIYKTYELKFESLYLVSLPVQKSYVFDNYILEVNVLGLWKHTSDHTF